VDDSRATDDADARASAPARGGVSTDGGRVTGGADRRSLDRDADRLDGGAGTSDGDPVGGSVGRLVVSEQWTPRADARTGAAVRRHLASDESLRHVAAARLLGDQRDPATVGVTDDRLLAVTADGGFVGVGLDRVSSVRSRPRTTLSVRGRDHRLLVGAGVLFAVAGFLGVLSTARPLSAALALVAAGGVLAVDRVRRVGVDFELALAALDRHDGETGLADRLRAVRRRVDASDDRLAFVAAVALAALALLVVVAVEPSLFAPLFVLATAAGVWLASYAVRHGNAFDDLELVARRQRTVSVAVDDGSVLAVRTHPDATLDRELARLTGRSGE
jgi:hypothetical protein